MNKIEYEVLEQNNIAVAHMMNGNLDEAHRKLRKAFEMAKCQVVIRQSAADQGEENEAAPSRHSALHRRLSILRRSDSMEMLRSTLRFGAGRHVINQGIILYTSYVLVAAGSTGAASDASESMLELEVDWTLVSAFICFNLGLVYSAAAQVNTKKDDSQNLRCKAIAMLDSCRRLLLNVCCAPDALLVATGNPVVDWLSLSTFTKLAEINYTRNDLSAGRSYSLQLDSFILTLQANPVYARDRELRDLLSRNYSRLSTSLSYFRNQDKDLSLALIAPAA